MTEQAVKDAISLEMPDWKKIAPGQTIKIEVDAQSLLSDEQARLRGYLKSADISSIVCRYPIRETPALGVIVKELGLKDCATYEAAVRKLMDDNREAKKQMLAFFGQLVGDLAT